MVKSTKFHTSKSIDFAQFSFQNGQICLLVNCSSLFWQSDLWFLLRAIGWAKFGVFYMEMTINTWTLCLINFRMFMSQGLWWTGGFLTDKFQAGNNFSEPVPISKDELLKSIINHSKFQIKKFFFQYIHMNVLYMSM